MRALKIIRDVICSCVCLSSAIAAPHSFAADTSAKPFAQQRVVLSLSDPSPRSQSSLMDVAFNLMSHYGGPDMIDIEVIAYGPGIRAVLADTALEAERVKSLVDNGVRFYVCGNSLDTLSSREKRDPVLLDSVERVPSGIAFILEEMDAGYKAVHP